MAKRTFYIIWCHASHLIRGKSGRGPLLRNWLDSEWWVIAFCITCSVQQQNNILLLVVVLLILLLSSVSVLLTHFNLNPQILHLSPWFSPPFHWQWGVREWPCGVQLPAGLNHDGHNHQRQTLAVVCGCNSQHMTVSSNWMADTPRAGHSLAGGKESWSCATWYQHHSWLQSQQPTAEGLRAADSTALAACVLVTKHEETCTQKQLIKRNERWTDWALAWPLHYMFYISHPTPRISEECAVGMDTAGHHWHKRIIVLIHTFRISAEL